MINKLPFFASLQKKKCNLFFLANNKVLDIEARVSESFDFKKNFSQIIPVMMFIKYACGDSSWHNRKAFASFIVDDPLLRKSYGFLNYQKLFEHMNQDNFFTNIAFIPWNYKRTREKIAKIFRERVNRFGLCVHGYDHTNNEFGINDFSELSRKASLANEKMMQHEKLTGIKFDKVLVFPQGKFSSKAIKALKCNNYCAAVNSTYLSTNSDKNFKISDLLDVAIMNYHCFPLFIRRYPGELIDFAFDLFVGKPAIIVEHHGYFRHGYNRLVDFIKSINCLDQNIHWDGLESIIKNSYLEKISSDGKKSIKIYSPKCEILNTSDNYNVYEVFKEECGDVPIVSVMVAGKETSYKYEGRFLTLKIEIPPKTAINIEIIYKQTNLPQRTKRGFIENIKVATRRYLSEFRDNFVSKNRFLLFLAKKIVKLKP